MSRCYALLPIHHVSYILLYIYDVSYIVFRMTYLFLIFTMYCLTAGAVLVEIFPYKYFKPSYNIACRMSYMLLLHIVLDIHHILHTACSTDAVLVEIFPYKYFKPSCNIACRMSYMLLLHIVLDMYYIPGAVLVEIFPYKYFKPSYLNLAATYGIHHRWRQVMTSDKTDRNHCLYLLICILYHHLHLHLYHNVTTVITLPPP